MTEQINPDLVIIGKIDPKITGCLQSIKDNWEIAAPFEDLLSIGVQTQVKDFVLKDKTLTGSTGELGKITLTMGDPICLTSDTTEGRFEIKSEGRINYFRSNKK